MSSTDSLTQKWLRQNVQSYSQNDRVFVDINASLARFAALRPKSEIYTYDDGRTQLLLCIYGLLPISYQQASYNIPIAVWLTKEYPRQPPIAYVVPTNDMLVKAGKYVDVSGRCQIEYIQHWQKKSEGCNLLALLEAMQDQFSREPPVFAKPKNSGSVRQTASPIQTTKSPGDRPMLPPKPGSSVNQIISQAPPNVQASSPSASVHSLSRAQSPALASRPPPPLPPQYETVSTPSTLHPHNRNTFAGNIPGPSSISREGNPLGANQRWSIPPQLPSVYPNPSSPGPVVTPPADPTTYLSPRNPQAYSPQPPPPPPPPPPQTRHTWSPPAPSRQSSIAVPNLLDEETLESQPPQSSSSAAPPPRPPNPELLRLHTQVHAKLTSDLTSLSRAMTLDAERLRAHQIDLLSGEPAIRDEMARLEAVRDVCRTVAVRMRGTVEQAERNVTDLRRKGDPEVDELVCSTTIVHNQLINLVAEDNAIEDTIYHLHRALNTGRVDLERFLRTTRVLAEEQFMKRALIEKIQAEMPMGMYTNSNWS